MKLALEIYGISTPSIINPKTPNGYIHIEIIKVMLFIHFCKNLYVYGIDLEMLWILIEGENKADSYWDTRMSK